MLNELPVGAAIAHGHEGAIARHVLELARRDRLRHSYKADRQRQSRRQPRRIFYEFATRGGGTTRLAFHPVKCTTISGTVKPVKEGSLSCSAGCKRALLECPSRFFCCGVRRFIH